MDEKHVTPAVPMTTTEPGGVEEEDTFEVTFLATVGILGVLGNLLVFIVYTRKRHRRSNAVLYILNLALGDMLALVVVIFHITEFFEVTWPVLWRTDIQCQVHRYFRFVAFDLTVFNMVAIAIDRYFAVVHPLRFRLTFSARRTKVICVSVWGLACLAALPTPFMFKTYYRNDPSSGVTYTGKLPFACKVVTPFGPWWPEFKNIYLNIVLFYIPTVLTAVLYVSIIIRIRRTTRPQHAIGSKVTKADLRRKSSWRSARTLLVVFVAYVVCYGSFATYNVLSKYTFKDSIPAVIYNVCLLLPYANSCMNPIIYSFINPSFRKSCWELLCKQNKRSLGRSSAKYAGQESQLVVLKMITNGNFSSNAGLSKHEASCITEGNSSDSVTSIPDFPLSLKFNKSVARWTVNFTNGLPKLVYIVKPCKTTCRRIIITFIWTSVKLGLGGHFWRRNINFRMRNSKKVW